ncbi:MAG: metallophosphatase family protein [Chloroflexi bacterium]|nr:metallophosphatase family protein [Chloroflexota bacterium]MCI0576883.1 metallophosphatase family protein [Chloroflexota bacterium]MCI0646463.1 metallophosphatase family protein [Chloroflexota bacterium]MCI0729916.1 metallophosphatase family protein [Chloroflexota bacterium]
MRVIVISDMHGNCVALDAVLAEIKQETADQIICLGDALQGGPQPVEVLQRLQAWQIPVVMGNADAWLLSGEETGKEQIPAERLGQLETVRQWTLAQLSEADRAYIAGFRPTIEIPLGANRSLLCFHGSPASFDDLIFPYTPEEAFRGYLGAFSSSILTGGHTHLQQLRRIDDSFFFNPGSIGVVYNHNQPDGPTIHLDGWAEYAVLTVTGQRIGLEFKRTPIDVAALIRAYRESGRPYAEKAIAEYGRGKQ